MNKLNTYLAVALLTLATSTFAQVQKIQTLQITGGSPGAGKFLVSDANGNASWQTAGQAGLVVSGESVVNTIVVPVTSSTGKIWMDRNLGASRVAQSFNDYMAYGSLYQWGRGNDGHQLINWTSATSGTPVNGTTTTQSTTDYPNNNLFILPIGYSDWRATPNNNLWQGVAGVNNPCPEGFRLPTFAELTAEFTAHGITNSATAFASPFKFTVPGYRDTLNDDSSGELLTTGDYGIFWTSTIDNNTVIVLGYSLVELFEASIAKSNSHSVRCIKN